MHVLQRHRVVSALLLVLTFAATAVAFTKQPWTYQATSSVVFVPSPAFAKATGGGNPYLAFTTSVNQMGDVIRYQVSDTREQTVLASEGYTSGYTITDAIDTAAPILLIAVTGHDEAGVEHTLSGVDAAIASQLAVMQAGMKEADKMKERVLTYANKPTRLSSSKVRTAVVFLVISVLLSLGILLILDCVSAGRGSRRRGGRGGRADQRAAGTKKMGYLSRRPWRLARDSRKGKEFEPSMLSQR